MQGTGFAKKAGKNVLFFIIAQAANMLVHSDKNVESKNVASLCRPSNDLKNTIYPRVFYTCV